MGKIDYEILRNRIIHDSGSVTEFCRHTHISRTRLEGCFKRGKCLPEGMIERISNALGVDHNEVTELFFRRRNE